MEKKIARISRWLERCARACSSRSWEGALLDMECAKAELDEARAELWSLASGHLRGHMAAGRAGLAVRSLALGILLVLLIAAPLAVQSQSVHVAWGPALEWVTADEMALLAALRRSLSEANLAYISSEAPGQEEQQKEDPGPEQRKAFQADMTAKRPESAEKKQSLRGALPGGTAVRNGFDEILTLVQIGQKALREKESPIRYDR